MEAVKRISDHVGEQSEKFFKTTLFQSKNLLLGINCLEPGQTQKPHDHKDQDKFYFVVEGNGSFWLGNEKIDAAAGEVIWAPAGIVHGVANESTMRLTLLVGIAPAP